MYLKSIEIQGFKSFANKLFFEFDKGFTGIVGPNGSGKSNIADAVRWVLGEQSAKQLRGASMQDVIFAGTENRKPLSYAYVAITFDNADRALPIDYAEVTVARRVYRSGESEYILNGNPCRLKDVQELFYDTGLGKEGYSIIGQGQIDKILSGRPEERRELFDEAAGIVKFKRRRNATEKKLESERENLVRINDILTEQERQLIPLEKQAQSARVFLQKKEELKIYDVNAYLLETERIRGELTKVVENLDIAERDLGNVRQEKQKNEEAYETLQESMDHIDRKSAEISEKLNEAGLLGEKLEGQINVYREQINSAAVSDEHFINRKAAIADEIEEKTKEKASHEKDKKSLDSDVSSASKKTKAAAGRLSEIQAKLSKSRDENEACKNEILDLMNEMAAKKVSIQKNVTLSEQIVIKQADINKRSIERASEEAVAEKEMKEAQKVLEDVEKRGRETADRLKSIEQEIKTRTESIDSDKQKLSETQNEFNSVRSRHEALVNIAERYDGYGQTTKKIMEKKADTPGVLGVVAELMSVEKKYETAIETALGGNIQNIVTDNERTAKELIEYLKKNRFGRATFLPLTSVKGSDTSKYEAALGDKGAIGMADTLLECDDKYREVYKYLLGRVVVVDNIDNAYAIAKKHSYSLHIVTLEGEYLSPGGSVSGGAFKNNSNLLGRNREIIELEKKVKSLASVIKDLSKKIDDGEMARAVYEMDFDEVKENLQKLAIEKNTAEINFSRLKEQAEQTKRVHSDLAGEQKRLKAEEQDLKSQLEKDRSELANAEKKKEELEQRSAELSKETDKLGLDEEREKLAYQQVQIDEASAKAKAGFASENIERLTAEIEKLKEESVDIDKSLKESTADVREKEKAIKELEDRIKAGAKEIESLKEEQKKNASEKEKLSAENKEFYSKVEEVNGRISALERETYRLGEQKRKLEDNLSYQNSYMWQEYELTLHACTDLRDERFTNLQELKRNISRVKDEIKALGNVNVNALEDYKELNERYSFMKLQRDDLVEAEASLVKLIEELESGMRAQFTEKFERIKEEFNKTFKELFGGGKGELELVEDENGNVDILECGIRIIAQPPGKKLQNMMQLSGGEKALSAISLLFAIQNLKPSPFCLLDEIEAALDDPNVDRFAKYLSKLTDKSQFIVITHRRGTMNAADCLYGITMQEKGVSALVSVNLIDAQLDQPPKK